MSGWQGTNLISQSDGKVVLLHVVGNFPPSTPYLLLTHPHLPSLYALMNIILVIFATPVEFQLVFEQCHPSDRERHLQRNHAVVSHNMGPETKQLCSQDVRKVAV